MNPWRFSDKLYQHTTIMPGARYWLVESYMRGWFVGANMVATAYNHRGLVGNNIGYFSSKHRYKGWGLGGGASAGYSIPISKRWNVEFEAGVSVLHMYHHIYHEEGEVRKIGYQKGWFVVPGKIAANIVYLF